MAPIPTRVCCYLRWRVFDEGDPESRTPHAEEGFFVCTHTQEAFGPDGRVADEGGCREPRECYQIPDQPGGPTVAAPEIPPVEIVEAESGVR